MDLCGVMGGGGGGGGGVIIKPSKVVYDHQK